jgi:hypothetical protein
MQHAGGVLLAAGLDGGNTMIESSPVTGTDDFFNDIRFYRNG